MLTKTPINKALSAAEHPILLESVTQLEAAAREWENATLLGIDTEFVRERTYRADLGLVQVSDGETAWLIDPISIGSLDALTRMMNRPETMKILHSGTEDLEVLLNTLGELPEPMVDTQVACALLGQPLQLGYHHAVKWLLDEDIDKDQTRSNWLRRPLTSKQLRYAAMDVVLLPMMFEILQQRLNDLGRWAWLEEEAARMKQTAATPIMHEDAYLRFARTGRMDQPSLRVLQALAAWREDTASERNRARGFVIPDSALMQMAQQKPGRVSELEEIDDIHPGALARYDEKLVELISDALSSQSTIARIEEFGNAQKKQLNAMRRTVQACSKELGVDPALLASRRELEKLIRAMNDGEAVPERFLGWRKGVITDDLLESGA